MKKVLTFLTLAAALVAVSCAKEQENPYEGGSMVTYTIDGPAQVATKAMGTIGSEYTLYYEVRLFNSTTSALGEKLEGTGLSGSKDIAADKWPTTVSFDLARGKQYKILFWAQSKTAPTGLYTTSDLTNIAIDYSKMAASNEDCDAFYGSDVIIPAGATSAAATLQRPFALVNLGTNDAVQFKTASGGCTVGDVQVTVKGNLASSFNVATGAPGAGVPTNFSPNAAPIDDIDAHTLVVNATEYNYLSAVYVLPATASDVIEVDYTIKDDQTTPADITSLKVTNVPVKANHRTNITGKLLTGATTYAIGVDQAFAGNTNKVVGPTFANVTALNAYFATLADNSDNGDINPEEVTLAAIADGETITLPAIAGGVVIRITGTLATGTLNIAYAASGDKPANLSLFVAQLEKLVANITSTHFTLLSGSHITDQADVHTSGSTFVIEQGAKVGTVNIHQGNAEIAGEVAKVAVPAGASADGDGAPVQVKLEKESAVEQIVLNAATDVVVEQPKDNIEVSGTEYKVKVDVNADNCSAKAQNGGQIYVVVAAGVSNCTVSADGESEAQSASGATIAEVGTGSTVDTYEGGEGVVTINTGVDPSQVNEKEYEAKIGNVYYEKVQQAFEAAIVGDTVVVLVDEYTKINSGTYVLDPAAYVADGYLSYPNADGTFTVVPGILVQHNGTDDTDKNHTANGTLIKNAVQNAADGTSIYLTSGIYWLPGDDFRFPDNKSFSIIGIGNVQIFSNGYGFAVNKSEHEGIAVTLKNLTITNGPNKPNAVYIKDYMVLTLEDVVLHNYAVGNKYSIVLDSSNPINDAFDSNKTTTVIAKNVSIDDGLKIGLMAMPRKHYIDKGYSATISTKCSVTYDSYCVNFEGNIEAQNGEACSTGNNLIVNGVALPESPVPPTEFNVSTAAEFISVFSNNALRTKNTQIYINADIDLSDAEAHSPIDISNMDKASITVNGNNHIIKGMKKPMFDQCFVASITVNDLTFKDCNITEASDGYVAAIVAYYDAGKFLNVTNVTFDNCDLSISTTNKDGSNYAGLIYGAGGGYSDQSDGPVHMVATINNCTIKDCDLTITAGGGSVGAIAGHAAWNPWTILTVENCSITNSTTTTTKANKAGSFFGTVGCAGDTPLYGRACGVYVKDCTWSGNTATAKVKDKPDVVSPYIFGRVAQTGGKLFMYEGGEYVVAAHYDGKDNVVDQPDLVSEDRFSNQ